ncbi:hypothetical protein MKS88_001737 [Plasmodium brasilianum]|uniref:Fam-l protein n=2 Tax=Plasmodium (Plasmodium) TaxID=418103 RepID=A0A1D3JGR6_PLAMA|nr:Plasmodium exported protein, unknown function [Plasmodium malariae]KAI4839834.1 hypothetical protein MKS88_001737 [Plasmodium brasilianum]SBT85444.1 Plasmodium exported protein, unknown function [Plasmodium malariae]
MEQKIKLLFFIKIITFIYLTRLCLFYNDTNNLNKFLGAIENFDRILYVRNYRLLGHNGKEIFFKIGVSKEEIPYCIKKTNEKSNKNKISYLCKSSLTNNGWSKKPMKYNKKIFNTTHSHIEKNFLNALDKMCFLKKIRINNDETYRKLKNKKYRLRLSFLLLVFLFVLMIPVLDSSLTYWGPKNGLLGAMGLLSTRTPISGSCLTGGDIKVSGLIATWFQLSAKSFIAIETTLSILLYCVPFLILAIIILLVVVYYYKNSIKNQKIKFKETFYE